MSWIDDDLKKLFPENKWRDLISAFISAFSFVIAIMLVCLLIAASVGALLAMTKMVWTYVLTGG